MSFYLYEKMYRIDYEDPILLDKELIKLASKALGGKSPYTWWEASTQTVRNRLHSDVPLLRWLKVKTARELRDTDRREELIMALQVINNDIKASIFFSHIKKTQVELVETL